MLVIISIIGVVLLAVGFITINSVTGGVASYSAYGGSKVYGGNIQKQAKINANEYLAEMRKIAEVQEFMYDNKDKWECTFGMEARNSAYPCMFDSKLRKYCCITDGSYHS